MDCTCSVVIPTYNRASSLNAALECLVNQRFKDFEVIVVDDGSTDDTYQICKSYQDRLRLRYFFQENWGGPAQPRNRGITEADGQYIAFLDSDDCWYPDKLLKCIGYLERGADLVYHDLRQVNASAAKVRHRKKARKIPTGNVFCSLLMKGNWIDNSSVVTKKDLLLSVGGFDESRELIGAEDYDMWLRVALKTERFEKISEELGEYRVGNEKLTTNDRFKRYTYFLMRKYENSVSKREKRYPFFVERALALLSLEEGEYTKCLGYVCQAMNCSRYSANAIQKAGLLIRITMSVMMIGLSKGARNI